MPKNGEGGMTEKDVLAYSQKDLEAFESFEGEEPRLARTNSDVSTGSLIDDGTSSRTSLVSAGQSHRKLGDIAFSGSTVDAFTSHIEFTPIFVVVVEDDADEEELVPHFEHAGCEVRIVHNKDELLPEEFPATDCMYASGIVGRDEVFEKYRREILDLKEFLNCSTVVVADTTPNGGNDLIKSSEVLMTPLDSATVAVTIRMCVQVKKNERLLSYITDEQQKMLKLRKDFMDATKRMSQMEARIKSLKMRRARQARKFKMGDLRLPSHPEEGGGDEKHPPPAKEDLPSESPMVMAVKLIKQAINEEEDAILEGKRDKLQEPSENAQLLQLMEDILRKLSEGNIHELELSEDEDTDEDMMKRMNSMRMKSFSAKREDLDKRLDVMSRRWLYKEFSRANEMKSKTDANKLLSEFHNELPSEQSVRAANATSRAHSDINLKLQSVIPGWRDLILTWDFNSMSYSKDVNYAVVYNMYHELDLVKQCRLPVDKLRSFLQTIFDGYREVPYHNVFHMVDVTHATYVLMNQEPAKSKLTRWDKFALLTSAVCHDVDHPGCNNAHIIARKDELALLYNDQSVLENHHLALAFSAASMPEKDIFENMPDSDFRELRQTMIDAILATDMSSHFEHISKLKTRVELKPWDWDDLNDRRMVIRTILKCADLGHTIRPWNLHRHRSELMRDEFFRQGDVERERGMKVSPLMDRNMVDFPRSQTQFLKFVVTPLFEAFSHLMDAAKGLLAQIETNSGKWAEMIEDKPKHEEEKKPAPEKKPAALPKMKKDRPTFSMRPAGGPSPNPTPTPAQNGHSHVNGGGEQPRPASVAAVRSPSMGGRKQVSNGESFVPSRKSPLPGPSGGVPSWTTANHPPSSPPLQHHTSSVTFPKIAPGKAPVTSKSRGGQRLPRRF
eukprot:CAMPEP_0113882666 /NCGR_PEP_ID=MMETSP0780_2-20120614/9104_1 /TAXON_ID=652834 /ORGANISM="Palpitomonas bilix" /LENGTH=898 /DNA_ID=CAMNT_0000869751 /DNA_START=340 /DNA_END=3036 /DNA_ORIENTATION=+ /assembly_acc=CAM_ASM_000599